MRRLRETTRRALAIVLALALAMSPLGGWRRVALADQPSAAPQAWDTTTTERSYEGDGWRATFTLTGHWDGGYNASVRVENTSGAQVEDWRLEMSWEGEPSHVWGATVESHGDGTIVFRNADWNQDIPTGSSVEFGMCGSSTFPGFPASCRMPGAEEGVPEGDYSVDFRVDSDWGSGRTCSVTIENKTDVELRDWSLAFELENEIADIWGATVTSHDGGRYVVRNPGYSQNIAPHGSVSFGFSATGPSGCSLTGVSLTRHVAGAAVRPPEREREPLEDIGEAHYKAPEEGDIATDGATGLRYVKRQLLVSAYPGTGRAPVEAAARELGAEVVGLIALTDDYQLEFPEERTPEELERSAAWFRSLSFVSAATLNLAHEAAPDAKTNDTMYNDTLTADYDDPIQKNTVFKSRADSWADVDGDNWGLEALNVPVAWDRKAEFAPVRVGVYDLGFEGHHPDLIFDDVVDNITDDGTKDTRRGITHGTHVSGIIAAGHNNDVGISGVATDTRLYAYAYQKGSFRTSMGDKYAYARLIGSHVKVINVSMYDFDLPTQYAASHGNVVAQREIQTHATILGEFFHKMLLAGYDFVIVSAAGNFEDVVLVGIEGGDPSEHPYGYRICNEQIDAGKQRYSGGILAKYNSIPNAIDDEYVARRIIVVGAVKHSWDTDTSSVSYAYASFSSVGDRVDVCAPGVEILSTVPAFDNVEGYALKDGTSMAAPYISGIAALMYQAKPSLNGSMIKGALVESGQEQGRSVKSEGHDYWMPDAAVCCDKARAYKDSGLNDVTWPTGILCGTVEGHDSADGSTTKTLSKASIVAIRKSTGEHNLDGYSIGFETDSDGNFAQELPQGTYDLILRAEEYLPICAHDVVVEPDKTVNRGTFVLGKWEEPPFGGFFYSVKGRVIDALSGSTISGATVKARPGWDNATGAYATGLLGDEKSATTREDGTFDLSITPGSYTVEVSKDGYVTGRYNVVATTSDDVTSMALSPTLPQDEYRIILTWGDTPRDLDSHLTLRSGGEKRLHVCYYHKSDSVDGGRISARLDLDDTTSFGPETVTMTVDVASLGENELIGYFVHDYSNRSRPDSRELSLSGAFVRVYSGNGLMATYYVPRDKGAGTVWHVFDIGRNGIIPAGELSHESNPGSVG